MKRNKYGAIKCEYKGVVMDSKLERDCAMVIDSMKWGNWAHHVKRIIWRTSCGELNRELDIWYEFDFVVAGDPEFIIEAKGKVLQDYRTKRKLIIDYCIRNHYCFYEYTAKKGMVRII